MSWWDERRDQRQADDETSEAEHLRDWGPTGRLQA